MNESAKTKNDKPFGRYINNEFKPLTEGPWYAAITSRRSITAWASAHQHEGPVLDIMDQEPIPGLYAAGEATGGIHGAVRLAPAPSSTALSTAASAVRKSPSNLSS